MTEAEPRDTERLRLLAQREAPVAPGRARPILAGAGFGLLFSVAAILAIAPGQVRSLLGFGTSQVAPVQQTASKEPGLSTELPRGIPAAEEPPINTEVPRRDPAGMSAGDQARLAALEAELRTLRDKQAGLSREELRTMLEANAAEIRGEVNRMLLSRNAVPAGIVPGTAEAEARKRMEEERARRAAIEEAQVKSRGLVIDGAGGTVPGSAGGDGRRLSGNEGFLASAAAESPETARATQLTDPARIIVQGSILEGVLETAITSDLPGAIRAVLSQDVLSYDGSAVLLPKGTRLIGTYSSDVRIAQRRALVAWNRAITPDGTSVALGGIGADALGRSGQTGDVNTHFRERFGSAALISMVGIAPQVIVGESTNGDAADAIDDLGDDLSSATGGALDAYLNIPPTISVAQGDRLTIFVNGDLVF